MDRPLVSICIPTFRGGAFIASTIESVLQQSHREIEVWVVDDASPDDTAAVVQAFPDPRLHYVRNDGNLGPGANWNRCLELARGRYYKLLPHDDLLQPGSLAEHVDIFERDVDERIALVFGSRIVIDDQGRQVIRRGLRGLGTGPLVAPSLVRRCVRAGTNLIGEPGNALIRRSVAERVGPYDARYPYLVDLDYWFRVLRHGNGYYTGRCSSAFRISKGSWSVALSLQQFSDWKGFVERVSEDESFGISKMDEQIGFLKAKFNTYARGIAYRTMLHKL